MKEILITNDDGFESEGLRKLIKMLKKEFKVKITIVAPATEKSACSHSITLTRPLKFVKVGKRFYKLDDGTPADCIYLALHALYKKRLPDLVISGINHGANISEDITYSGTCAGAMEAVLQGIPALALSQFFKKGENASKLDFKNALKITKKIIQTIFDKGFPLDKKEFLNVNFPSSKDEFKGIKITRAGKRVYNYKAYSNTNPRGVRYYWLAATGLDYEPQENSDISLLMKGYATITPIMLDLTAYNQIQTLEKWIKE
ncbi:5'/3'-nucleotidase SurE [Campylobacter sp. MIT 97-5078]|uniref:5'/3'-nucleotidase SurE n=1 Tax=Campylobacter sp. MIT 97-5078 TaxID=1548153 RepID=UPI0005131DAD|nr:5'/3'-nucleotidase SurE [Campylobacter sp. MIT 97-5078]KGI55781.1 stationary phase survival protein SurE [Campylobacter sp. MIT 97-5078]TQR27751.1 5'/3'-nucleotidase SurE [Campylobacter sp. MIT 97-5078]